MTAPPKIRVCFVCLGNICRSPTAEGVMLHLLRETELAAAVAIDSAGTAAYHTGERADPRSRQEALSRGVDLPSVARRFESHDFDRFDYVIAMDSQNRRDLIALARDEKDIAKVHLLRAFDPESIDDQDVPDPYYGGNRGFANVFEICEAGCRGLLAHVRAEHGL
jgi:protein-tyrosine phosphatase